MEDIEVDLPQYEMPGAGMQFHDVTALFEEAAVDMEPGEVLLMDGFSLHDAMSAFEIGEPRLDSGLTIEGEKRAPFNPLMPLLPQELCWIIDRSFAYEMEWHAGNLLSHTVYTLLYIHQLPDFEPDFIPSCFITKDDPLRPPELITVVLRAAIFGLLKCCDLSWRELSKGGVHDVEDWQSEKCEVSLLEAIPVIHVLSKLEEASVWLANSTVPVYWQDAIRARLIFRKTLLQIMEFDLYKDHTQFQALIEVARSHLQVIRANPSSEPEPESCARLAFDPFVSRRLNTFVPVRVVPLPTIEGTWTAVDALLDGWYELSLLSVTTHISTWETLGNLRQWLSSPSPQIAYVRSSTQSAFYNGVLVYNRFSLAWMVDRFFFETLGVTYASIVTTIQQRWTGSQPPALVNIERSLYKLIIPHIRGLWHNLPRKRRLFMKSLVEWHAFYDFLSVLVGSLDTRNLPKGNVILQVPNAALIWRLGVMREVVFSGFQLELYTAEEKPFAYWYSAQIMQTHLDCLDDMLLVVPLGSAAYQEMQFQYQLLTALEAMSFAMFAVCMPLMSFSWRMRPNFHRRYKWAYRPQYNEMETAVVVQPELHRFLPAASELLKEESFSPSDSFAFAQTILLQMVASGSAGGWAGRWAGDRLQFIQNLSDACGRLCKLPGSMVEMASFDVGLLKWDPQVHPWFPVLSLDGAERRRSMHVEHIV